MKFLVRLMCVLVFAILCVGSASPQEISASIRGTVTDETGAVVSATRITAIQAETGLQRTALSDSQGNYVVFELPVGHYRLEAEAKGFKKYGQDGITFYVNQT